MNHKGRRENDPHVRLSAAILTGGYRDLVAKHEPVRDQALAFFGLRRFELWADMVRVDYDVVTRAAANVEANGLPDGDRRRERYQRAKDES